MQVVARVGVFVNFDAVFCRKSVDEVTDAPLILVIEERPYAFCPLGTQSEMERAPWVKGAMELAAALAERAAVLGAGGGRDRGMRRDG